MDAERWREIDGLYQAAIDVEGAERAAILDKACSTDSELRSQVEAMLECDTQTGDFLEAPAMQLAARILAGAAQVGIPREVGHYRVLEKLGGAAWVWCTGRKTPNSAVRLR